MSSEIFRSDFNNALDREIARHQTAIDDLNSYRAIGPEKFETVFRRAHAVYDDVDMACQWLFRNLIRFDGRTPIQAVIDGEEEMVLTLLLRMEYGVYH